ncbi:hypothetical protein AB0K09_03470 [Streptomyces sp. NPDC049577]|uniref:hypothetical protein n=1 Tax=Streptomyces sp. NPDC049577 TaxID=3155153 RepID=UPI003437AF4D
MTATGEALLLVPVSTVPGTDLKALGQQLADAVVHLPYPAAAIFAPVGIPPEIAAATREVAERQGLAEAAADTGMFYARLWVCPPGQVTDFEVAVDCVQVWQEHVEGVARSGAVTVGCMPAPSPDGWFAGIVGCRTLLRTAGAPQGLIPEE